MVKSRMRERNSTKLIIGAATAPELTPYIVGCMINVPSEKMIRTFIEIPLFTRRWKEIGLDEDALTQLQIMLLKNPESGPIMEGTGGIRKVRFPLKNCGKRGSVRVCYVDFEEYEITYLITAFKKSEQENLTMEEKNVLKKLVKALKEEAMKNRR